MKFVYLLVIVTSAALLSCADENRKSLDAVAVPISERAATCADCSRDAALVVENLVRMGFQCGYGPVDVSRGYRCRGPGGEYPLPVNIFISPDLNVLVPITLAYHFHGWWRTPSESPFLGDNGDFGKFLAESKTNTVLIVPESIGKNETYVKNLGSPERLSAFFDQVEKRLIQAGLIIPFTTPRLLSGHSGAYVVLGSMGKWAAAGQVPKFQSLKGVALLDSAYGYRLGLVQFMDVLCANESSVYMLTYNPNEGGEGKRDTNQRIFEEVSSNKGCAATQIIHIEDTESHNAEFPKHHLSEFFKASSL